MGGVEGSSRRPRRWCDVTTAWQTVQIALIARLPTVGSTAAGGGFGADECPACSRRSWSSGCGTALGLFHVGVRIPNGGGRRAIRLTRGEIRVLGGASGAVWCALAVAAVPAIAILRSHTAGVGVMRANGIRSRCTCGCILCPRAKGFRELLSGAAVEMTRQCLRKRYGTLRNQSFLSEPGAFLRSKVSHAPSVVHTSLGVTCPALHSIWCRYGMTRVGYATPAPSAFMQRVTIYCRSALRTGSCIPFGHSVTSGCHQWFRRLLMGTAWGVSLSPGGQA